MCYFPASQSWPRNPQSEQRKLRALSLSLNILSLQHLKKKTKRYQSLLGASLCLMAGFSVRRQTLLLGENAQRLHMSGTRIKASRLLISRLAQDTTTALNAAIKERRRIIFLLLLRAHRTSQTIGKGSTASTVKESQSKHPPKILLVTSPLCSTSPSGNLP